jgi:hypothetical protein
MYYSIYFSYLKATKSLDKMTSLLLYGLECTFTITLYSCHLLKISWQYDSQALEAKYT